MNLWWFLRWGRNASHRNRIMYVKKLRKWGTQEEEKCRQSLVLTRKQQTSVTQTHWPQGIYWKTLSFYSAYTKIEQDQAILQLITVKKVQRRRPKVDNSDMQKDREVTKVYNLLIEDHPTKIFLSARPPFAAYWVSLILIYELYYSYTTACS